MWSRGSRSGSTTRDQCRPSAIGRNGDNRVFIDADPWSMLRGDHIKLRRGLSAAGYNGEVGDLSQWDDDRIATAAHS